MINKLKPGAPKIWLYFIAGVMWSGVGLWLSWLAYRWLKSGDLLISLVMTVVGILLTLAIYKLGFSAFANRNIHRIQNMASERPCIFAFQSWTSYPLVAVMISLGIFLREYSPIPKPYLAAMYIGIGGSLFLASFHYHRNVFGGSKQISEGSLK